LGTGEKRNGNHEENVDAIGEEIVSDKKHKKEGD